MNISKSEHTEVKASTEKPITASSGSKVIYDKNGIKVTETGRDYDFIATVENDTDKEYYIDELELSVPAHDWVGLLADEDGYRTVNYFKWLDVPPLTEQQVKDLWDTTALFIDWGDGSDSLCQENDYTLEQILDAMKKGGRVYIDEDPTEVKGTIEVKASSQPTSGKGDFTVIQEIYDDCEAYMDDVDGVKPVHTIEYDVNLDDILAMEPHMFDSKHGPMRGWTDETFKAGDAITEGGYYAFGFIKNAVSDDKMYADYKAYVAEHPEFKDPCRQIEIRINNPKCLPSAEKQRQKEAKEMGKFLGKKLGLNRYYDEVRSSTDIKASLKDRKDRFVVGRDFNTKDWWVYDDNTDSQTYYFDTEEEANDFVDTIVNLPNYSEELPYGGYKPTYDDEDIEGCGAIKASKNYPKYIERDGYVGTFKRVDPGVDGEEIPIYSFPGGETMADDYEIERGYNVKSSKKITISKRKVKASRTTMPASTKISKPVAKASVNEQAISHIKAAIDILGKSGKKDDVTKDSIANLATILFDIKASTEVASASKSSGKTIKDVIPEEKWAEIELVDGPGEGGGISYVGETLDNFMGECEMTGDEPYSELKKAFKECGVKFKDFKV